MKINQVDTRARPKITSKTGAAGGLVSIVIPAQEDEFPVLDWIACSYSVAGGGRLTVTIDGVVFLDLDITADGPYLFNPHQPLYDEEETKNVEMEITLSGVATSIGRLTVRTR